MDKQNLPSFSPSFTCKIYGQTGPNMYADFIHMILNDREIVFNKVSTQKDNRSEEIKTNTK